MDFTASLSYLQCLYNARLPMKLQYNTYRCHRVSNPIELVFANVNIGDDASCIFIVFNSSNAKDTFVKSTRMQRFV